MSAPADHDPNEARPLKRTGFFLMVFLLVALPGLVVQTLMGTDLDLNATLGPQPGGRLDGRLVARGSWAEEATPEELVGKTIDLYTIAIDGQRELVASVVSGPKGAFAFDAPPVEGKYELATGGGLWQRVLREASFLDRRGELAPHREFELPLRPGCALDVRLVSPDGAPPVSGHYDLSGALDDGAILGLIRARLHREARFEDGHISLDGLPPMEGELHVFFGAGEQLTLPLDLAPGRTSKRIDL